MAKVEKVLSESIPEVESYSPRIKFGGMFSNFVGNNQYSAQRRISRQRNENGPSSLSRVIEGEKAIKKGEILIPDLLARGMKVKVGDMVVIIATNKDGSVNGKQLKVGGILESATGPGRKRRLCPYRRRHGDSPDGRAGSKRNRHKAQQLRRN